MKQVLSRDQMHAFDQHAIEVCRVPGIVLMENAGRGGAETIEGWLGRRRRGGVRGARIVVLCGPGNNGGDGFVVARRLTLRGADVSVVLTTAADRLRGDARLNADAWRGLGYDVLEVLDDAQARGLRESLEGADLLVDALLGTGLDREVEGRLRTLIELVNDAPTPVVSLDIPSGLDSDRGVVLGAAVRAELTVTFAFRKLGQLCTIGAEHCGELVVVDIGVPSRVPSSLECAAELVETADVGQRLTRRSLSAHKGSAGRVLVVAGSPGKTGAALLAAQAAQRAGAGLVTVATLPEVADALDQRVVEVMTIRIDPAQLEGSIDRALASGDVVAVGPGLGLDATARALVERVVFGWDGIKVVDADAITLLSVDGSRLQSASGSVVLTPHPGEAGRLLGCSAADVEENRFGALSRLVELTGCVVLLKGPRTLVGAPGSPPLVVSVDCPALATGGAGDVLSGVIAAFGCHLPLRDAAVVGAFLHGAAARDWAERTGADRGLLAREVADGLPKALAAVAGPGWVLPD